jgi:hypothetical protein
VTSPGHGPKDACWADARAPVSAMVALERALRPEHFEGELDPELEDLIRGNEAERARAAVYRRTILNALRAGLESAFPALSVAWTLKMCLPRCNFS